MVNVFGNGLSERIHPCFHDEARAASGRMHLPVAGACNIQCGYCDRRHDCVNESRPGVTSRLMSPLEALEHVTMVLQRAPFIRVVGIAGPGDPLSTPEVTLQTFALVRSRFPHLGYCLSTNGLALLEHVGELWDVGVRFVTVTVNAVSPAVGATIYESVAWQGRRYTGTDAAELLWGRQLDGISALKRYGFTIKVNTVLVPGSNDGHILEVAREMSRLGVDRMNIIGLLPVKGTSLDSIPPPDAAMLAHQRKEAGKLLPQMTHCARCRADDAGLLGCPSLPSGDADSAR